MQEETNVIVTEEEFGIVERDNTKFEGTANETINILEENGKKVAVKESEKNSSKEFINI